jgi:hypothetical protein
LLYYDWGAKRKVLLLEQKHGDLVDFEVKADDLSKALTGRSRLDVILDIEGERSRLREKAKLVMSLLNFATLLSA